MSSAVCNCFKLVTAILLISPLLAGCDHDHELEESAPQNQITVGLITNNPNGLRNVEGFRSELTGLIEARGSAVEFRFSGKPTAKNELNAQLQAFVDEPVDLIFTAGTPTGVAAYRVTGESGVPVVFGVIANPLTAGVMTDLTRPGGNMTGVMLAQNQARRLSIFAEMLPARKRILVPFNPDDAAPASAVAQLPPIADQLGIELVLSEARNNDAVNQLLADFPAVDAVFLVPDSTVNRRLKDLLDLCEQRKIPVSGPSAAQVEAGALMTYGFIHKDAGAQAARIADRILRGADPATTPVETAESYLQVNLASAERIGLQISDNLLQRTDVILRTDKRSPQ